MVQVQGSYNMLLEMKSSKGVHVCTVVVIDLPAESTVPLEQVTGWYGSALEHFKSLACALFSKKKFGKHD